MNYEQLIKLFKVVDAIMKERSMLEKGKKYQLAPAINTVNVKTGRDEDCFKEKLSNIKPIYEIALRVRTQEEIERETVDHKISETKERQRAFAKYVEGLKEKLRQNTITAEEYRRAIANYQKRQRKTYNSQE